MRRLKHPLKVFLPCMGIASSIFFVSNSFAGGFQLWEQDASGVGDYHAGAAAEGDTAADEFFNPASITRLKKAQVSVGAALIGIDVKYTGLIPFDPFPPLPITDAPGGTVNGVPNIHLTMPLSNKWFLSFGATTPFGLETKYPDESYVNLLATKTRLLTVNLNPSLAYVVNDHLSLAFGFDVLYGQADYDADVFAPLTTKLSGWDYGYNAGALINVSSSTRLGVSYRSGITIVAKGDSEYGSIGSKASAKFPLPPTTIVSFYHDVNNQVSLMASVFYTQWSVFKELAIDNMAGPTTNFQPTGNLVLNENYRNTWNFAFGGKYHLNHFVSLEAGFGHDQTPTVLGYRDIRLPDADRWAASLGVNITPVPGFHWSMGWTHFFLPTTSIDNSKSYNASKSTIDPPTVSTGVAKGTVNVFGVQLSYDV